MQLFVHHGGQQQGPYPPEQIRALLETGAIQLTDLAWYEGAPNWLPLGSVPGFGNPSSATPPPPLLYPVPPPATSGLAITSLILGILSFFSLGLTAIPAVICGHVASSQIKKSGGRLAGRGLAIGGLVTGYFGFLFIFLGILAGIALPVFNAVGDRGLAVKGLAQAKQIALGCKLYAGDHDGKFPDNLDQLIPTYLTDRRLFICPLSRDQSPDGYDYFGGQDSDPPKNVLLSSKSMTKRQERIVIHVDCSGELRRD